VIAAQLAHSGAVSHPEGASANTAIESKQADLVSFAKPFIGNPDLVRRLREGLPLAASSPETYYQGGPHGCVDYPPLPGESSPHR
jgi:N-ethylmaleimide reductase